MAGSQGFLWFGPLFPGQKNGLLSLHVAGYSSPVTVEQTPPPWKSWPGQLFNRDLHQVLLG